MRFFTHKCQPKLNEINNFSQQNLLFITWNNYAVYAKICFCSFVQLTKFLTSEADKRFRENLRATTKAFVPSTGPIRIPVPDKTSEGDEEAEVQKDGDEAGGSGKDQ